MKRILYLVIAAFVALMVLVPTAMAQETKMEDKDLPKSGGLTAPSVLLPAAALLLGSGVVAVAVLRRR